MLLLTRRFYTADVNPLLKLAIPLILTGLIESSSPFFGTMFIAKLGQEELAAAALVRGLFFTLMVILWGTLTSVSVLVAQKHGEKNDQAIAQILRDGSMLAFLITPSAFLLLWYVAPVFSLFGQSTTVIHLAQEYLRSTAWGMLPDFMGLVLLQFLIGLGQTRVSMIFVICWQILAIFLNYVLIFGYYGFPKLGISGIGWGLTFSYWISVSVLLLYLFMSDKYKKYMYDALSPQPFSFLKELLQIGVPLGSMYCLEVGFFFVLTLAMGLIGEAQLAATQITMQYLGFLTSVVFSIAQAVTVRMGHKLGEKNIIAADEAHKAGIFLAVSFTLIVAFFYLFSPELLIGVDLKMTDPENADVIRYSKQFFALCAFFQLFESARIAILGSLRALKDTRFTLIASFFGFWVIPLMLAYLFVQMHFGGASLWLGMAIGAACNAFMLHLRYKVKLRQHEI